ncbi:MAG: hypothetical protein J5850_00660, partial [Clostridia bacterium]|nr:hypothetical protein [Clostridia bacterium]
MRRIKSILAICVLFTIIMICAVSAAASLSSNVSVYWNVKETEAWAENVCSGPLYSNFYATA